MKIRVGNGYDVHQLAENRPLILGGITIPHSKGALGHSDADVVCHSICDALLGAVNLRNIGYHFSNQDPRWKDISSAVFLTRVVEMIEEKGFKINNIDVCIVLEVPKLNPYIPEMKKNLANVMKISEEDISLKATTSERMGFVGREEGIVAYAVALVVSI